MDLLRAIWQGWKRFSHAVGRVQTMILLTLIYFLIIPFFSLMRLKDPLGKRLGSDSYWQPFKGKPLSLSQFERMF